MEKERVSQDYAAEVLDTCLKAGSTRLFYAYYVQ